MTTVHDVVGVGYGPANLALAIALDELPEPPSMLFLEAHDNPGWQREMLLDGADTQHHAVRDLVSLRNPRSRYSFINYLHENGRLLKFLNLPAPFPLRAEYMQYIDWVRQNLPVDVRYGTRVREIVASADVAGCYDVVCEDGTVHVARHVALGPGRTPMVPETFAPLLGDKVFHLTEYGSRIAGIFAGRPDGGAGARIAVVGGSQSAVEIALDLSDRFPRAHTTIVTRGWSLRAKDHSPFSEEIYFPAFTEYYYRAGDEERRRLDRFTRPTNYSASDSDVLERLYLRIYEDELMGRDRVRVVGDVDVERAVAAGDALDLELVNRTNGDKELLRADAVVLATGFRDSGIRAHDERHHPLLDRVADAFLPDSSGALLTREDYSLAPRDPATGLMFLNGLCEATHGIGDAGSFSLLSLRAEKIAGSLAGALNSAVPEAAPRSEHAA
ncbi:SidA/IucD/PvdA family monooxygenase [Myceligenerans crystallogenes]|uniref:L-lysine N6-monooxygenase MbtG n=1 Tax=Myceligenerans crystallogenes TaxID=316335 RepID=A0ABN2N8J4_9MICO